jgi:hypothetical protein
MHRAEHHLSLRYTALHHNDQSLKREPRAINILHLWLRVMFDTGLLPASCSAGNHDILRRLDTPEAEDLLRLLTQLYSTLATQCSDSTFGLASLYRLDLLDHDPSRTVAL